MLGNSMNKIIGLFMLLTMPACAGTGKLPTQNTVNYVDIDRFMGRWYVIAAIPTSFEKGAVNSVETYTWNEAKKRIDIDFRFKQDTVDGAEKIIPQKGFIHNTQTNAEWRIQPFWPLLLAYLIVDLADNYSDTIIGVPNRKNVWIMSRNPKMDERRYQELVSKVIALGYDPKDLVKVEQSW
jgi:apolipoprotein D and lipocalin family protein